MKCQACTEVIPSKFAHSIKTNVCPFCGGEIMSAALQKILTSLQMLMKKAEPFMAEVEEWFSSNYSLRKVGSKDPSNIVDDEDNSEAAIRKQIAAEKAALDFQKRSGVKVPTMKSLLEKIQAGGGAADPSEFVGEDPDYGHIDMSNGAKSGSPLTQNDILQMEAAIDQGQDSISSNDDDSVKNYYEIQKLKKLQRQLPSGGGRFNRSE